ncbi:hypothetical protein PAXRUDRAFT_826215 [Paxillus rubicundulus Ve08.2h10]|uniref:Calmodulin-lysine N-methyltransferase n=1 Tax=Paxillus rubicundulus Ve08.2h10 TaxID=930991 RepID=A0A0D0E4P3_9AGAM|nr:hypothetical protein PAXRUDRAFT_826215 [Paxillus rubicundulus Ve08.2h10]
MVELGAGCALPSLLAATLAQPPSLIVVIDYPDAGILGNLKANVERNRGHYRSPCEVRCVGYEWGTEVTHLLNIFQPDDCPLPGCEVVIMSGLLHFDSPVMCSFQARVYVAAGEYTAPHVCDNFLNSGLNAGLIWEEGTSCRGGDPRNDTWMGTIGAAGLDIARLSTRKGMCQWWIGR